MKSCLDTYVTKLQNSKGRSVRAAGEKRQNLAKGEVTPAATLETGAQCGRCGGNTAGEGWGKTAAST